MSTYKLLPLNMTSNALFASSTGTDNFTLANDTLNWKLRVIRLW